MKTKNQLVLIVAVAAIIGISSQAFMFGKKIEPVNMTTEELAKFDGIDGRSLYVAVNGEIYDLTKCKYWKKGVHTVSPSEAIGGRDMTEILKKSAHGMSRVKRYPMVGYLVDKK